jgi:hypothetical protein
MSIFSIPRRFAGKIRRIAWNIQNQARLLLKATLTVMVRTNVRRWREVAKNPHPHWDGRNQLIANFIPRGSSVIDLGCGAQTLRRHLDPSCKYQPCDVIKSTPDVIVCDFNSGIYPCVSVTYDYVVCSGVLEYIRNPAEFIKKNALLGNVMILTYNPLNKVRGDTKIVRLNCDWVNHLTKPEIESLFEKLGLTWKILNIAEVGDTIYSKPGEIIYSLHKSIKTS